MNQIIVKGKDGKKRLVNVPSHNIAVNEVGWDSHGGYNDYANFLSPLLYLDAGRIDSYNTSSYNGYPVSTTTWVDVASSGSAQNGTLTNGASYSSDNFGTMNFVSASSQWVSVPDLGSLPRFTVITFAKFDAPPVAGTNALVTNRFQSGDTNLNFAIGSFGLDNKIVGGYFTGGTGWKYPTGYTVSTNTWYMFGVTFDATTIRFYVNGAEYSNLTAAATVSTSTRGINIAKRWDSSVAGDFFDGMIPVVLIYNKVLSASDITLVYNQFAPRYRLI
jgi:hypothetical protein